MTALVLIVKKNHMMETFYVAVALQWTGSKVELNKKSCSNKSDKVNNLKFLELNHWWSYDCFHLEEKNLWLLGVLGTC